MTTLENAARQALDALEEYQNEGAPFMSCDAAVEALRQALEQPKQEPVTWMYSDAEGNNPVPLYTEPLKREWVGLTDEEIGDALIDLPVLGNGYFLRIARAIETALKEKNT